MARQALEPDDYTYVDYRRATFSLGIAAAGHVWLAGSTAARYDPDRKAVVVEGDLVAQASLINAKMRCVLASGGLGLGHVERVVQYVTPAALPDLARLDALQAATFTAGASIATILVERLLRAEALIEIEAIAAPQPTGDIRYVPTIVDGDAGQAWRRAEAALQALGPVDMLRTFEMRTMASTEMPPPNHAGDGALCRTLMPRLASRSDGVQIEMSAVRRGGTERILSVAIEGDPAAGDVAAQCRDVYRKIEAVLKSRGAGLETVVKTTEFVTPEGLPLYRNTAAVRRELFAAPYPAATGVLCTRLGRPGAQISVEATAIAGAP